MLFNHLPRRLTTGLATGAIAIALSACDSATLTQVPFDPPTDNSSTPASGNIVDTAIAAGNFNTLAAALGATGLDTVLADDAGTFTVFAPTDDAFAALGEDTIEELLADPETLRDILLYHVISGSVEDANTAISLAGTSVEAGNGGNLDISLDNGGLFLNDSRVTATNINATNGIIHVIDKVLLPPVENGNIVDTAVAAGLFNTLVAALNATGLDAALSDESRTFTVFAPTDAAFDVLGSDTVEALFADTKLLSDILLYHVISDAAIDAATAISLAGQTVEATNGDDLSLTLNGDNLLINGATVTATDIQTSNGIIHVIDAVLLPPQNDGESGGSGSIVDTAIATGSFTTLVAALQATGLDTVLADDSQTYTVFAPTDEAFAALGEDTLTALLADPDTLSNILLYHVIGGTAINAESAIGIAGTKVTAANDEEFALSLNDGALYVNLSEVVATDVAASNGIIHGIDTVLLPPTIEETHGTVIDLALTDGRFTTLVTALQATGLDIVLADHSAIYTVFAPTNDAFAALGEDTINNLLNDTETLSNILLTHVIGGATIDAVTAFSLSGGSAETAGGTSVDLSITDNALFINNAQVIETDIKAENGIIHVIDAVISNTH